CHSRYVKLAGVRESVIKALLGLQMGIIWHFVVRVCVAQFVNFIISPFKIIMPFELIMHRATKKRTLPTPVRSRAKVSKQDDVTIPSSYMETLPDLCLLAIFGNLSVRELLRLQTVCRRWNNMLSIACRTRRSLTLMVGHDSLQLLTTGAVFKPETDAGQNYLLWQIENSRLDLTNI